MTRSSYKAPFLDPALLTPLLEEGSRSAHPIQTQSRSSIILPSMVGRTFLVHTGLRYGKVVVNSAMVGHKLGEYANTRTPRRKVKGKKR